MHQSTTGERVTAVLSTLVAIAILGAAVTAQQSRTPQTDRLASLESDLRFQLDLAFRADGKALKSHLAALESTLEAWRESPRRVADDRLLADWLQSAISHTLPESDGALPPTPDFSDEPPVIVTAKHAPASIPQAEPTPDLADATPVAPAPPKPAQSSAAPRITAPLVDHSSNRPQVNAGASSAATTQVAGTTSNPQTQSSTTEQTPPAPVAEHSIRIPATEMEVASARQAPVASTVAPIPDASADVAPATANGTSSHAAPQTHAAKPVVSVNLAELNARIGGYNQDLADVEAALVANSKPSAQQLEVLVTQLEDLATKYEFVALYYDSLTKNERIRVTPPRSMDDAVNIVTRCAAGQGDRDDFLADFESSSGKEPTLAARLKTVAKAVRGSDVEGR